MAAKKVSKKEIKVKMIPVIEPLSVSIKKAFSKSEIINSIAEVVGLEKKQAAAAIDSLTYIIEAHISKRGPGVFVFPGIAKFKVIRKPATKAREGKNPFTGEPMTFEAKPACNVVRIKVLKRLKDAINIVFGRALIQRW